MKFAAGVLCLSLISGCSTFTTTRTIGGPPAPVPHENPTIQPAVEPLELGWFSKALVIGGLGLLGWMIWKWDD